MSKIPQGEWNAIAARYQNGESISKIARSYECTPPAIHYILKRNRQRPPEFLVEPMPLPPAESAQTRLVRADRPLTMAAPSGETFAADASDSPVARASANNPAPGMPSLARSVTATPIAAPASVFSNFRAPAGTPACRAAPPVLPGLDSELRLRAEAAIERFRSSFDAALAEGSPVVCERLRQAATDLMRVAARTTIVLDRLNAITERSDRAHTYPHSAHAGENFGKLG